MTLEKKDLTKLSDKELFDYLEENLKKSKKKNPVKKLMKEMESREKAH